MGTDWLGYERSSFSGRPRAEVSLLDLSSEPHPTEPFNPHGDNPFEEYGEDAFELEDLHNSDIYSEDEHGLTHQPAGAIRSTPGVLTQTNEDQAPRNFDIRGVFSRIFRRGPRRARENEIRTIYINELSPPESFRGNHISTTKYNVATFLPKFLFEQFSKYSNLFFLFTALIQQVPHVSPTNRYTTIGTLMIVLLVSAVKELIEDFKRFSADKEQNSAKIKYLDLTLGRFMEKRWNQIKVGDIVRVENEQQMPADLILLSSSEPQGLCYIETSNLDGEANLKIKQSSTQTNNLQTEAKLAQFTATLESEAPNSSLYTYEGTLTINDGRKVPLNPDQLLLRGTSLRNTQWVYGVVIFTGHETKLMRNATAAPIKRTAVEHMINLQIVFLFTILIGMSIMSSLGNVITYSRWKDNSKYLRLGSTNATSTFFLGLLTYWILYSNLVPISLFVTVEVIKYYLAYLISSDLEIYDPETDTQAICRTSSLVEELGQIQYVFSDKTGTLTRNIMEFKACCIGDRIYTTEVPEDKRESRLKYHEMQEIHTHKLEQQSKEEIDALFLSIAVCHTVIPEQKPTEIKYQASSPDEGALVEGAARWGYKLVSRMPQSIEIEYNGQLCEYELLNICEFNSTRKRMSTIYRCPDGKIRLFCKGADTVIFERLSPEEADQPRMQSASSSLEEFASTGLRTLCFAMREIDENEFAVWQKQHDEAATALHNRAQLLSEAAEAIEQNLHLIGTTGVEDKLQDGVPETIHLLQDAGIKFWVLTGDRQETAINVGMSCKLLSEDMNLLIVNESTQSLVAENIRKKLDLIRTSEINQADLDSLALVIDGVSLGFALDPSVEQDFVDLAVLCKAVICCRVSPLQKALVVKMVKRHLKALLLAIGDGANDVSMIQAAHVGVGISGMEGQQAARSADVSIAQFRFLKKLLLVHGAWNYNRLSKAILYCFYKNIALYFTQFWYVFMNGFSGDSIYESWTVTFYNIICTALPPFALGIFDQFVSARQLERYPQLYKLGQEGAFLNVTKFWQWIANAIYHSIIIFFFSVGIYTSGNVLSTGLVADHWTWGVATFTACCFCALGKAALATTMWNQYTLFAIPGSALIWMAFFPVYSLVAPVAQVSMEYSGVLVSTYGSLAFWLTCLLIPVACLMRDLAWKFYRRQYRPETHHFIQEMQKYKTTDYRPRVGMFQNQIRKVRQVHRMRKQRGYAFSQADEGVEKIIRAYDTRQPAR